MTKLEERLWNAYLDEACKYHANTSPNQTLKEYIRKDIGHRITAIDNLPDRTVRKEAILGAIICVRSAGYVSAMVARQESKDPTVITLTETAYELAFDIVRTIYHGVPGDRICTQPLDPVE